VQEMEALITGSCSLDTLGPHPLVEKLQCVSWRRWRKRNYMSHELSPCIHWELICYWRRFLQSSCILSGLGGGKGDPPLMNWLLRSIGDSSEGGK
jgi:hypothetical protein